MTGCACVYKLEAMLLARSIGLVGCYDARLLQESATVYVWELRVLCLAAFALPVETQQVLYTSGLKDSCYALEV